MKAKSLIDAVEGVTGKWAKQRKQEEREASARRNRGYVMRRVREMSAKEAGEHVFPDAWDKASGGGRYPASARQIYYAARGPMEALTGKPLSYNYFAQSLLPDFIEERGLTWDVTFDARGNFHEPHTEKTVPLGTLQVRSYLREVGNAIPVPGIPQIELNTRFPTIGPRHRFGAILFLEKEGFSPLLAAAKIAERYDVGIMSTKGMSVTAARRLVEQLCGEHDVPLLVLHDFDVSGFTICGTLQESTRRYQFTSDFDVVDLGLRLDDVGDLEPEDVFLKAGTDFKALGRTLRRYGATEAEVDFLLTRRQRVELNAMTSPQFIEFLEEKFDEHGIAKLVPAGETLALAARRAARIAKIQKQIDELATTAEEIELPDDLEAKVREALDEEPERTWDEVLVEIMREHQEPCSSEDPT